MITKKEITKEAKRLLAEFKTTDLAKKAIAEIQRVLAYLPEKDRYGLNWREYFKRVSAELEKM